MSITVGMGQPFPKLQADLLLFFAGFPLLDPDANVMHSWFSGTLQLELENPFDIQ